MLCVARPSLTCIGRPVGWTFHGFTPSLRSKRPWYLAESIVVGIIQAPGARSTAINWLRTAGSDRLAHSLIKMLSAHVGILKGPHELRRMLENGGY